MSVKNIINIYLAATDDEKADVPTTSDLARFFTKLPLALLRGGPSEPGLSPMPALNASSSGTQSHWASNDMENGVNGMPWAVAICWHSDGWPTMMQRRSDSMTTTRTRSVGAMVRTNASTSASRTNQADQNSEVGTESAIPHRCRSAFIWPHSACASHSGELLSASAHALVISGVSGE